METILRMYSHNPTDHFILDGKEVKYDNYLLDCVVKSCYEKNGETYYILGRNFISFLFVAEMLANIGGRHIVGAEETLTDYGWNVDSTNY